MRVGHPEICLFQPEIPQNTGNIGRIAAATQCRLHLIQPFGFATDDRQLLRPGLDYWPYLDLEIHPSLDRLLQRFDRSEVAFFSKRGEQSYDAIQPAPRLLVFGRETSGLPAELHAAYSDRMYRIPIFHGQVRSLNLANSVAVVVYDQLRQRAAKSL